MSPADIEKLKKDTILRPLNSPEDLRAWMFLYFDIEFPSGVVYPTSTHGPIEAAWRIYELFKTGKSEDVPQVCMLSSRDSYKTLLAAALEVLCMIHFRMPCCHMAAIESQSLKAVQYVNSFFRKIRPYLEAHGWKKNSDNKRMIEWITDDGTNIYLKIIVATIAGANSEHVPMLCIDEVDVVQNPKALNEAKMIPSTYGDINPLTIYLSTRKFAGGMMEKTLKETEAAGGEILRWNILDITERIPEDVSLKHLPKVTRYLARQLPLENLSPEEWSRLTDESKLKYEKFEAYAGIAEHPLLPVMKNMLADRPQSDHGFLYKRIKAVRNNFRQLPPDMGEAQLLCNKPSASGLVYSRFENHLNIIEIADALFRLTDEQHLNDDMEYFRHYLTSLGVTFIGGGDFGFTDYTSLIVLALLPGGEVWLIDSIVEQKLELDDIVKYTLELQERWGVDRWYMEQAYPAYLKTMRRKGIKCPEFTKVVADGITAIQGKIVDSSNIRKFFIIKQPQTQMAIDAFGEYKWALDGKGDVIEGKPYHDKDGVSDIMDSLRYPFQNLFNNGSRKKVMNMADGIERAPIDAPSRAVEEQNKRIMTHKIQSLAINSPKTEKKKSGRRILF
jgi:hypothetical protein